MKKCRDLSIGFGGFYDPSYRNGGKLHLKMLCLGKNWDPETSMYGDQRPIASLGSLSYPFVRKLLQVLTLLSGTVVKLLYFPSAVFDTTVFSMLMLN